LASQSCTIAAPTTHGRSSNRYPRCSMRVWSWVSTDSSALCGYQLGRIGTMIHGWNRGHMQTCRTCDGVLLYPDIRHSQNMFFLIHLVTSHDNAK
jgi:hypothetical protein